mgnify:CR=1 FL=1
MELRTAQVLFHIQVNRQADPNNQSNIEHADQNHEKIYKHATLPFYVAILPSYVESNLWQLCKHATQLYSCVSLCNTHKIDVLMKKYIVREYEDEIEF